MKVVSEKKYFTEKIFEKIKPYYHKDNIELNEVLYKNKYFEMSGRSFEVWVNNLSNNKIKNLWNDLKNLNL
jgi:hypothetical protein